MTSLKLTIRVVTQRLNPPQKHRRPLGRRKTFTSTFREDDWRRTKVQTLRLAVSMFLESVAILDGAIAQLASERLNGQPVLFRDISAKLDEKLQMAEGLSEDFNLLARGVDVAEISLEALRKSLQSETDRQISIWVQLARSAVLSTFGTEQQLHAAIGHGLLLFKSNCGPVP